MAEPRPPQPVKLICGILTGQAWRLEPVRRSLAEAFGSIDLVSDVWPFDQTRYYQPQMGPNLLRQFVAFDRLMDPGTLATVKLRTNALEVELAGQASADVPRPINLDPGYVALGQLVLASTKPSAHRVYLQDGIYAEVTLQFAHGEWQALAWTYPDFRMERYHGWLKEVRQALHRQLNLHAAGQERKS